MTVDGGDMAFFVELNFRRLDSGSCTKLGGSMINYLLS
jgi:hypothetical protein